MTKYMTCNGCILQHKACAKRESVRKAVAGLGVTTMKFRCAGRLPLYMTGQRVSFPWRVFSDCGYDYYSEPDEETLTFRGTVIQECKGGNRYVVLVDSGPCVASDDLELNAEEVFKNENLLIKVKRTDITPLDEGPVKVCVACASLDTSRCLKGDYITLPPNALCMEKSA